MFTKNNGFTLAEVLITLGIIGIVAAMTIPNLLQKNYEKKAVSKLLETQSILTQAMRMAEEEYGEFETWGIVHYTKDSESIKKVAKYLLQFLKVAHDCGTLDEKAVCVPSHSYLTYSKKPVEQLYSTELGYYKIVLFNGTSVWFLRPMDKFNTGLWFYVDINGKNLPNTIGKDLFLFEYRDKALFPAGAPNSNMDYRTNCKPDKDGWGCSYYVVHHKNMNYLHNK